MLFVTSTSQATRHAVYAIERNPPATIRASGATISAIVEQFPWGPTGEVYDVSSVKDFIDTFAPGGMDRTGSGYMTVIGKAWPILKVVRVLGDDAEYASADVGSGGGGEGTITLQAKYKGVSGNDLTWEVKAASDGDANHFDLEVTLSTVYGTTTDKFTNLNYSGVDDDSTPNFAGMKLIGAITKTVSGTQSTDTGVFTLGDDGAISSATYVGTQGAGDKGIALLENDKLVDAVLVGDPGNSLRAAVNAGLVAHADYLTDRVAFINGDSGMTGAEARTDVADYRSLRCVYVDCWAYQRDDVDGTERLVPPAAFAASAAANLSPSTSFSWKSITVQRLLSSISKLETVRGSAAYLNELAGICTLQREDNAGFSFECAVITAAPLAPNKRKFKRTRMGHYIARAVINSLREFVDSPNVAYNQQDEVNAVQEFLDQLKQNVTRDPNNLPHIVDFVMRPLGDFNSQESIDSGEFTIASDVKISSDQERIFYSLQIGETVKIQSQL